MPARAPLWGLAAALAAHPAQAGVKASSATGFDIEIVASVAAPPQRVWDALARPQRWWNPAHSYSGDAARLSLDPRAGGCFCERLGDGATAGSVEHARVVFAQPARTLRLIGGLGPLQAEPVNAVLTWTLQPTGAGTTLTLRYTVAGAMRGGGATLAPVVDRVLAEQVARLTSSIDKQS